jgi:hypothetical protein
VPQAIDMNQDNYLEEAFKFRNLLEEFDPLRSPDVKAHRDELQRPNPANNGADGSRASDNGILKCAILGFRENIFTANLMSVGTYMSLMEATFVSMTLRTFAWLGARMHYGHPDCLSFGTRVALANGDSIAAEDIVAGQKLVGEDGTVVEVEFAEHAETKHAFTITTAAGPLTVSAGHKLTLRSNHTGGAAQLEAPLHFGQLVEVKAEQLHKRWNEWRMGSPDALFTARRVPLPRKLSAAGFQDAAIPLVDAVRQTVCMDYSLAVTGAASYEPLSSSAALPQAKIVYQLHNPLTGGFGEQCYTFLQLERMHAELKLDLSRDTGLLLTELNPIAEATEQRYEETCLASMRAALASSSVSTVVAFGKHCRHRWQALASELSDAGVPVATRLFGAAKGLLLCVNGREVRVIFSPHPCAWYAMDRLVHAVAAAHGVPTNTAEAVVQAAAVERVDILSIAPLNSQLAAAPATVAAIGTAELEAATTGGEKQDALRIVNIGIKGDRKRYALADGTLTHNCLDKIFFMTRGGMSKASKMIHVSEDIFAGFKSTLRGGRILHKEYIQCGKGRDLGFNQLYLFEAKLASVS